MFPALSMLRSLKKVPRTIQCGGLFSAPFRRGKPPAQNSAPGAFESIRISSADISRAHSDRSSSS